MQRHLNKPLQIKVKKSKFARVHPANHFHSSTSSSFSIGKMKVCEISRVASSTWCPYPEFSNYIAVGGNQPSLDSLSAGASLEIFSSELGTHESKLIGAIQASDRFTRLSWGMSSKFSHGLLAGGMVDGTIGIWNPEKIISNSY